MVAQPTPAREYKWTPLSITPVILKMQMVQSPEWIESFHAGLLALLPIHPPEINARVVFADAPLSAIGRQSLKWMVEDFKVAFHEARVRDVKGNRCFRLWINTHPLSHSLILFFVRMYSVSRMQIERGAQSL